MQECIKKWLLEIVTHLNKILILFLFLNLVKYSHILDLTIIFTKIFWQII